MGGEASTVPPSGRNPWRDVSIALLVGLIVLGSSVFLVIVLDASIGPSIVAAPLFVWNTTAASIALVLLWKDNKYGYAVSILTAVLIILSLALIATGVYGSVKPGSSPVGPLSYAALALALIATTYAAWRNRAPTRSTQAPKNSLS